MDTLLLLSSGSLVGLWVLAASFGMDVIRHLESHAGERRAAGGRILAAPSAWQSVAA
jgi:hypothetical protein